MRRRTQDLLWLVVFVVALAVWLGLIGHWSTLLYEQAEARPVTDLNNLHPLEGTATRYDREPSRLPVRNLLWRHHDREAESEVDAV